MEPPTLYARKRVNVSGFTGIVVVAMTINIISLMVLIASPSDTEPGPQGDAVRSAGLERFVGALEADRGRGSAQLLIATRIGEPQGELSPRPPHNQGAVKGTRSERASLIYTQTIHRNDGFQDDFPERPRVPQVTGREAIRREFQ